MTLQARQSHGTRGKSILSLQPETQPSNQKLSAYMYRRAEEHTFVQSEFGNEEE
jgi:hypothetical protein